MLLNCGVGEDSWESRLDCKEIQPVHPKGNQSWIFVGRTDAEAETPILWPPDSKNWLIWKDPDAGKDWRPEEKGRTEDEMIRWYLTNSIDMIWPSSGSWWWTGKPGMLQSMGYQRVRHDWVTELNWIPSVGFPQWLSCEDSTHNAWDAVWSLDWDNTLEKEMASHCNILAGIIPWTEEPGRL